MQSMEGYLLWNFCMDLLVCAACALACGRDRLWPCLPAAVLGAAYALAAAKWTRLGGLPCAALVGACMAAISARPETLAMAARAVCALCAAGLFAGGAQLLVVQQTGRASAGALAAAACALGLDLWLVRSRRVRLATWNVQLILRTGAGVARFRALVDTGNRLHEPISGLPVMIVEEKALRGALPEDFDARRAADRLPPGWRLVSYGVLGSAGRMACFRPGRLMVSYGGRWLLAPDVWVAVYPGRIPGQVAALAPTVLGAIRPAEGRPGREKGRKRGA